MSKAKVKNGVGAAILEARTKRKMTQAELAEAVGTSQQAVFGWENGKCNPSKKRIPAVARALRIPQRALVNA